MFPLAWFCCVEDQCSVSLLLVRTPVLLCSKGLAACSSHNTREKTETEGGGSQTRLEMVVRTPKHSVFRLCELYLSRVSQNKMAMPLNRITYGSDMMILMKSYQEESRVTKSKSVDDDKSFPTPPHWHPPSVCPLCSSIFHISI